MELSASSKNGVLLLGVTDNGAGMSQEELMRIFEWNSIRSDSSELGLKLAREFTEKLNGSISVQSNPAKGTSFLLTFPIL